MMGEALLGTAKHPGLMDSLVAVKVLLQIPQRVLEAELDERLFEVLTQEPEVAVEASAQVVSE